LPACGPDAEPDTRIRLGLTQLAGCPVPSEASSVELEALGDFPSSNRDFESLKLDSPGVELTFPDNASAVRARLLDVPQPFIGWAERQPAEVGIDVLLWPERESCALFEPAQTDAYPARGGGQALGYHPGVGVALLAGGDAGEGAAVVGALSFDARTGEAELADAQARHGLLEPRAFATVTAFGDALLVAGGEDPLIPGLEPARRAVLRSAELYEPGEGRFSLELLELRRGRARHGALVLASGETLLLAGRGEDGLPLCSLEAVSPETRTSSLSGLATLEVCRVDPRALRLSDDRIFVAGGEDADGSPPGTLEWLSTDGSALELVVVDGAPPARFDRAFAPLDGGSVLAVGGCEPVDDPDADACAPCRRGCAPENWDAWWITSEGRAVEIEPLPFAAPEPVLIPAADGAPWLVLRDGANGEPVLFRFDPWRARFERAPTPPADVPPAGSRAVLPLDAGAFLWLDEADPPALFGARFGVRNPHSRDVPLVTLTNDGDALWPLHLVPDRPPSSDTVSYDGELHLARGSVWISDTRYRGFIATLVVTAGDPPIVLLDGESFGDAGCPWPEAAEPETLELERAASTLFLRRGGEESECAVAPGAHRLGFAAPDDATASLASIAVERRSEPSAPALE
jgi:hypothetical protein